MKIYYAILMNTIILEYIVLIKLFERFRLFDIIFIIYLFYISIFLDKYSWLTIFYKLQFVGVEIFLTLVPLSSELNLMCELIYLLEDQMTGKSKL
jgi:hypothetical protein